MLKIGIGLMLISLTLYPLGHWPTAGGALFGLGLLVAVFGNIVMSWWTK